MFTLSESAARQALCKEPLAAGGDQSEWGHQSKTDDGSQGGDMG